MHACWQTASRTKLIDKIERQDAEIERQRREIERLEEDRARFERERARWVQERARLERERTRYRSEQHRLRQKIDRLEGLLAAAQRAGFRQAAPFSKGPPTRRPNVRAGRRVLRMGAPRIASPRDRWTSGSGRRCRLSAPVVAAPCVGAAWRYSSRKTSRRCGRSSASSTSTWDSAVRAGSACRAAIRCRPPTRWARRPRKSGPRPSRWRPYCIRGWGSRLPRWRACCANNSASGSRRGGLVHALHRVARQGAPSYAALQATVRGSPVVSPDETGWKVAAHLEWLWAFATPDTTVYAILPGCGFEEATSVLGADYAGVLMRDGWAPYRRFSHAVFQTCLAHLLRRSRALERDHGDHA